jgi:hypothetical protein
MDVGFYLGELLMQQGEVSVPGLGYFVQVRVSGYYDEATRKFNPPYHQAQFDVQSIDDDALAEYIAEKKNISVASAKYFAEKYITNLKQQALLGEVPIGNLGWFYTELAQLTFKPADKIIDDTIFYGFEPISINKIGDIKKVEERPKVELNFPPKFDPPKPAVTEDQQEEISASAEPVQTVMPARVYDEEQAGISSEFFDPDSEEEEETQGPLRLLLIILIAIVVIGVGIFALYRYKPDTFAKMVFWKHETKIADSIKPKPIIAAKPVVVDTVKADTIKKDTVTVKKDTVVKAAPKKTETVIVQPAKPAPKKTETIIIEPVKPKPAPKKTETIISRQPATITSSAVPVTTQPVVTTPKKTKAVVTGAPAEVAGRTGAINARPSDAVGTRRFEVYAKITDNVAEANAAIKQMRKAGLNPRLVTDAAGPLHYHISIGHFATKDEAKKFAADAINAGKVPGGNAYGIEIIPDANTSKAAPADKPVTAMDKLENNSQILAPPSTATGTRRFEVIAYTSESIAATNAAVKRLRSGGFDPRWVKDSAGSLYNLSIGHFATKQEATDFALKANIPDGSTFVREINPQK